MLLIICLIIIKVLKGKTEMILISEPTLQIAYLVIGLSISLYALIKSNKRISWLVAGVIGLTTIISDSFYIIPSFFNLTFTNEAMDMVSFLNIGNAITSIITTTIFVLFYWFFKIKSNKRDTVLIDVSVISLAVIRIVFALFPSYEWFTNDGFLNGLIRNIPVFLLGLILVITIIMWAKEEREKAARYAFIISSIAMLLVLSINFDINKYIPIVIGGFVITIFTISIWLLTSKAIKKQE